jgi:hypothetical protein
MSPGPAEAHPAARVIAKSMNSANLRIGTSSSSQIRALEGSGIRWRKRYETAIKSYKLW